MAQNTFGCALFLAPIVVALCAICVRTRAARALPVRLGLATRSYAPSSFICRLIATSDAQLRARVACRTRAHDQSVELVVRQCFSRLTQHRLHRTQPMFCGSRALVSLRLRLCCESVRSRTSLVDTSTHTRNSVNAVFAALAWRRRALATRATQ